MSVFDNPLIKTLAIKALKKDLDSKGLHGYYMTIDSEGEVHLIPYATDPQQTINNLKKTLLTIS
jgi:hypothetical protein